MITKELIESCYNWIGYGNPDAPIWIVGKEEGTLEVDEKKKTHEESILIRSKFTQVMDFGDVWESKFGVRLGTVTGKSQPWRFTARFILSLRGELLNDTSINKFIINQLGRIGSDHFLAEYLPLPKKNVQTVDKYKDYWKTVNDYWKEVKELRLEKISSSLVNSSSIKLIITYDKTFAKDLIKKFDGALLENWLSTNGRDEFGIYEIKLRGKTIYLLETPFFGNGRISSLDVPVAVGKVKNFII